MKQKRYIEMAEHTAFLKKVAEARKHQREYIETGTAIYQWMLFLGFLGIFVMPLVSANNLYLYFSFAVGTFGALTNLYKTEKNRKEFPKKFPEEADLIAEHDELMK